MDGTEVPEGLRVEDLPDDVLDVKPAELLSVFVRALIVHRDEDSGDNPGEYDVRIGVAGDDDLVGNQVAARWQGSVRSGEESEVLGWVGPVSVSPPDGVLRVGVAGHEDDFLVDDAVLGGIAILGPGEEWGIDRWWRTINGDACEIVFAVVRTPEGEALPPAPVLLDAPAVRASGYPVSLSVESPTAAATRPPRRVRDRPKRSAVPGRGAIGCVTRRSRCR